jgi:hypothetical protein
MLEAAAKNGSACPSNEDICERVGASSPATGARLVSALETMGLIKVERFLQSRIVTIVDTGESTAIVHRTPRPARKRVRKGRLEDFKGAADFVPVVHVSREPCFCCGVRADIGCKHGNPRFVTAMSL